MGHDRRVLSYADEGAGSVVVLLHGWPVTPLHWRRITPGLIDAGFRVLTVTLPGLGDAKDETLAGNDSDSVGALDKPGLAMAVARRLADLHVNDVAVVGHDWGATVAYLVAASVDLQPDVRVRALVVEEEVPPGVSAEIPSPGRASYPDWHGPFLRVPGLAEALLPGREDVFHRAFLKASAGPTGLEAATIEVYLDAYRGRRAVAAAAGYYRTTSQDAAAVLKVATNPLTAPVLSIGGSHGMGTAVRDAFKQLANHVEHLQVPAAGHYPAEQNSDAILPRLLTHLQRGG